MFNTDKPLLTTKVTFMIGYKDIVMKKTKKGRKYYGCIDNPECDFMVWQKPSGEKCPRCGKLLLEKGNKLVCMDEQCGYVKNKPTEEK